jgi:2-phosphosulfolactate phosphatase
MDIHYATLETCSAATGTVVVIDVWRSFTTTAFAFAAGACEIVTVGSLEEALALRDRIPGALLMGMGVSVAGPPAEGYDYANSPVDLQESDLNGRRLVQCTPNGTRGIAYSQSAETLLAGSFVCAGATVRYIKQHSPAQVTFVSTESGEGEDRICGEYMAALLCDKALDVTAELNRIRKVALERTRGAIAKGSMTDAQGAKLMAGFDYCFTLDRFDFAMVVKQREGLLVMEPVSV